MNDLEIRIVQLESLQVASFHGFGTSPESEALQAMQTWANEHNLLTSGEQFRLFGFNNPDPHPGSPNYGYEVWLVPGSAINADESVEVKTIAGGLYAVTKVVGIENIGATWQRLVEWRENSPYHPAHHQWLEEHLSTLDTPLDSFALDLFLPIAAS